MIRCVTLLMQSLLRKKSVFGGTTLLPNDLEDTKTFLIRSHNRNWKALDFNSCHIQDHGLRLLHCNLCHSDITIERLRLANNNLSSSSDSLLSDMIIACKVKVVNIGHNITVGETYHFITTVLSHPSTMIEDLYMYKNNYSSTKWATHLFSFLGDNKTLKRLMIHRNNISDDVCYDICDSTNDTLKELYMWDNPITGQASLLILDFLKDNDMLEKLQLPKYSEDINKEFTSLQQAVNEKRRSRECDIKLEIEF